MANGNFGGGNGNIENPYIIEDAWDLNAIRNGTNYYKHFKLKNDIDMTTYNNTLDSTGWTPIPELRGSLDGNGFVITNLYINRSGPGEGLFVDLWRGQIRNLGLEFVYINGGTASTNSYQGALVCRMNTRECLVENCFVEGTMIGYSYQGGLVGICSLGTVKNCWSNVKMTGTSHSGGVVGQVLNGSITNCMGIGIIGTGSSTTATMGMVVGSATTSTVTSCYGITTGHGVAGGGGASSRKTLVELQTPSTFVGWDSPDYDFITKVWDFVSGDTPKLTWQNRIKYMVYVNSVYKTFDFTTNTWVDKGSTLPSDDEFQINGINRWELALIPKMRWKDFMNYNSFELVSNNDKQRMIRSTSLLTLSQSKQVSDGVIMKATVNFSTLGDAINQMKITY